jgi:DME family drug/metabolite transporter
MEPTFGRGEAPELPRLDASQPQRAALLVLLASFLFGTAGTARAILAPVASDVSVGALRALVGGLSLMVVMPWIGGSRSRALALLRRKPVLLMGCSSALYQVSFFSAVGTAGVALGTLLTVGSVPVIAGSLGWVVLRHRPSLIWIGATTIALIGLVLLSKDAIAGSRGGIGVVFALLAGLCNAAYNVAGRQLIDEGTEPMEMVATTFTVGGILLVPGLLVQPLAWLWTPSGLLLALYLGTATAALANTWLAHGVAELGPGPAATLMLMDPVTAAVLGVAVLGEAIRPTAATGIVLVFAGLALQTAAARWQPSRLPRANGDS